MYVFKNTCFACYSTVYSLYRFFFPFCILFFQLCMFKNNELQTLKRVFFPFCILFFQLCMFFKIDALHVILRFMHYIVSSSHSACLITIDINYKHLKRFFVPILHTFLPIMNVFQNRCFACYV